METVPTCSGILSDGQPGPLLAQGEDVAAAGAENAVHGGTVACKARRRDKGLDGAGEAAPLHPPGPATALQDMLAEGQRHRKVLVGGVGAAVNVLAEGEGIVAALPHQRQERIEAARPQGAVFGQGAGVFPEKVGRPQAGAVPARSSPSAWIFSTRGVSGSSKSAKITPPRALASWSSMPLGLPK